MLKAFRTETLPYLLERPSNSITGACSAAVLATTGRYSASLLKASRWRGATGLAADDGIEAQIVWETATRNLPAWVPRLRQIVDEAADLQLFAAL